MQTTQEMKLESISLTAKSKALRNWEGVMKRKAIKAKEKGKNFPSFTIRLNVYYSERMRVRKESRYLGLARGFLNGTPFKVIEQSNREGNEPKAWMIADELVYFGFCPSIENKVEEWLET